MTADLFCTRCGHRNPADSNFCSSCGSPLEPAGEDRPTINFQVDGLSGEHQIEIDLDDVPAGGMLLVRSGLRIAARINLERCD